MIKEGLGIYISILDQSIGLNKLSLWIRRSTNEFGIKWGDPDRGNDRPTISVRT